jgi:molecular chaperone GrpE
LNQEKENAKKEKQEAAENTAAEKETADKKIAENTGEEKQEEAENTTAENATAEKETAEKMAENTGEEKPTAETQGGEGNQVPDAELLKKELEETKKKLEETEKALAKQKDILLRTAAEYDNYRKRTAREKEALYNDAVADAVKEFLGVEDNLERALEQKECSVEALRTGVEMTHKQMLAALEKLGVTEMGKEGEPFDPMKHNAVAHIEDENLGENVVAKVFQKGYCIGDKVIRHAMVQAAN